MVLHSQTKTRASKKLHQGWCGPFKVPKVISEVTYLITPEGKWTDKRPIIPCVIHRLKRYSPDTASQMGKIAEMSMEELVQNLVDDTDENLEASGEVVIPTNWQEQETHRTIEVRAEEENETMVDLGPIDLSEGQISEGGMEYGTNREVGEEEILSRVVEYEIINRGVI